MTRAKLDLPSFWSIPLNSAKPIMTKSPQVPVPCPHRVPSCSQGWDQGGSATRDVAEVSDNLGPLHDQRPMGIIAVGQHYSAVVILKITPLQKVEFLSAEPAALARDLMCKIPRS